MRAKRIRPLLCLLAAVLCITVLTAPALAGDDDWCEYGDYGTQDGETETPPSEPEDQNTGTEDVTPPPASTPDTETPPPAPAPEPEPEKPDPEPDPVPGPGASDPAPDTQAPEGHAEPEPQEPAPTPSQPEGEKPDSGTGPLPGKPAPDETPEAPSKEDEGLDPGEGDVDGETEKDGGDGRGTPFTPEGNMDLVDDVLQTNGGDADELEEKQFIIVQSKNGNYFYIVIDRSGDTENVHFLNQVDEADLLALIEDGVVDSEPLTCTCTDKCMVGAVNTACPVCQVAMSECAGKAPEPDPDPEPDPEPEPEPEPQKSGMGSILIVVLVVALAAGGAFYWLKLRKPKPDNKGPVDLDDYDFGEDEDDYPMEPDDDDTGGPDQDS